MKLERSLGFWNVFCIAAGAMISSGLFVLPALAFIQSGPAVVLAYAIAAVFVIPTVFSQIELTSAMPKAGGTYFFIERSMGALPGLLAGLGNWMSIALKSAFALIGIGAFLQLIWVDASENLIKAVAIAACIVFTLMNLRSVKSTGRFQVIMVAGLVAILVAFILAGVSSPAMHHKRFAGFLDKGFGNILATAGLVFISYGGLTKVVDIGGEVRNPGRNVPLGIVSAWIIVSLLYVAAVFVTIGVLDPSELYDTARGYVNLTPLCVAAEKFLFGRFGLVLLSAAALLAFMTTANAGILTASRSPMAMSHDGLLPAWLQKVSRYGTPHASILLTSGFLIAVIALLSIKSLAEVASVMMLTVFLLINVAVLIMRGSKIQNYRPLFRSPLFPWVQICGVLLYLLLIVAMTIAGGEWLPVTIAACFVLVAVLWYMLYVRPHIDRESAFVYMVRNAVSKDMYRSELEEELKRIAIERDDITLDRFDELISKCTILDVPGPIGADEMFQKVSAAIAERVGVDEKLLLELFRRREQESSTVIQPGLAIPHVIVPGKGVFEICLLRCMEGVNYAGQGEPVRTAFVLLGSADQRNYHLKALMAVAHIVQENDFIKRWLEAPSAEHLRDLVLLSSRQRHIA